MLSSGDQTFIDNLIAKNGYEYTGLKKGLFIFKSYSIKQDYWFRFHKIECAICGGDYYTQPRSNSKAHMSCQARRQLSERRKA